MRFGVHCRKCRCQSRIFPHSMNSTRMGGDTLFELQTFDRFRLCGESGSVAVRGDKFRVFIACLASTSGRLYDRDQLTGLFWADSEDRQAKQNLRGFLSRARRLLGPASLIVEGASVGLNAELIQCDSASFEALARSVRIAEQTRALTLYRGSYLDGLARGETEWEEWVAVQRRRYHKLAVESAISIAREYASQNEQAKALEIASRAIDLEPFQEEAQEILICSLVALDRKAEGLAHYQQYTARLQRELDTNPGRRLGELIDRIRAGSVIDSPIEASRIAKTPVSDRYSIALMPFEHLGRDSGQEAFCLGVSEDILIELSRFRDLFVIDRHSSFADSLASASADEIRDTLGVQYLVRGSIQLYTARLRLSVRLIDTEDNRQVWAERYDRKLSEIFQVQDDLVRSISATIVGWMERRGREKSRLKPTSDLQAYELVIQGRKHFLQMMPAQNRLARDLFQNAIERDADYCAAHTWLAEAHLGDWAGGWTAVPENSLALGHKIATHAIGLDDTDSRSHTALARALLWKGNFDRSAHHFERALDLNSSDTWVLTSAARFYLLEGHADRGLQLIERAARLSPLSRLNYHLGIAYFATRQYDQAAVALRAVSDPIDLVYAWLAASLAMLGESDKATATARQFDVSYRERYRELHKGSVPSAIGYLCERFPFRRERDRSRFVQSLKLAGLGPD